MELNYNDKIIFQDKCLEYLSNLDEEVGDICLSLYDRIWEALSKLQKEIIYGKSEEFCTSLISGILHHSADLGNMNFIRKDINTLSSLLISIHGIQILIFDIENDKDRFTIQKFAKQATDIFDEIVNGSINRNIEQEFFDYGCSNWKKRYIDFLFTLKDESF